MILRYASFILISCLLLISTNECVQTPHINSISSLALGTEVLLKNGMKVCLKQSDKEPGKFHFELFSMKGYGSLPLSDRSSAWLAAETVWESGLDHQSADELACTLDDRAIDMEVNIGLFDCYIEAKGPTTELAYSLHVAHLLFTEPLFKEEALQKVVAKARDKLQKKAQSGDLTNREIALKVNMCHWEVLSSFTPFDLNRVQLEKIQTCFKKFFYDPSEFTLVLVGDFDPKIAIPLLEKTLGSLPIRPYQQWNQPIPPAFPKGITKKEFSGITRYKTTLTRLTFPLAIPIEIPSLDFFCYILKNFFSLHSECSQDLIISYEFPLYPRFDKAWLVIQFSSPVSEVLSKSHSIVKTLQFIKEKQLIEKEGDKIYQEFIKRKALFTDDESELFFIINYYRAGGNIETVYTLSQEKEMIKKVLDCYPTFDQYSIISLHP